MSMRAPWAGLTLGALATVLLTPVGYGAVMAQSGAEGEVRWAELWAGSQAWVGATLALTVVAGAVCAAWSHLTRPGQGGGARAQLARALQQGACAGAIAGAVVYLMVGSAASGVLGLQALAHQGGRVADEAQRLRVLTHCSISLAELAGLAPVALIGGMALLTAAGAGLGCLLRLPHLGKTPNPLPDALLAGLWASLAACAFANALGVLPEASRAAQRVADAQRRLGDLDQSARTLVDAPIILTVGALAICSALCWRWIGRNWRHQDEAGAWQAVRLLAVLLLLATAAPLAYFVAKVRATAGLAHMVAALGVAISALNAIYAAYEAQASHPRSTQEVVLTRPSDYLRLAVLFSLLGCAVIYAGGGSFYISLWWGLDPHLNALASAGRVSQSVEATLRGLYIAHRNSSLAIMALLAGLSLGMSALLAWHVSRCRQEHARLAWRVRLLSRDLAGRGSADP